MRGRVKFFNTTRRFGFVVADSGEEVYFNEASLPRDRRFDPVEGDAVTFEIRAARKGTVAHQIEQCE